MMLQNMEMLNSQLLDWDLWTALRLIELGQANSRREEADIRGRRRDLKAINVIMKILIIVWGRNVF
jgi:hypothetical protein